MMINNIEVEINSVNGTAHLDGGPSLGREVGEEQPTTGRYPVTARRKFEKLTNMVIMECYYRSNPGRRGYRKRMEAVWREKGLFELSEQRLADQVRVIKVNKLLSDIELEEISRMVSAGESLVHGETESVAETEVTGAEESGTFAFGIQEEVADVKENPDFEDGAEIPYQISELLVEEIAGLNTEQVEMLFRLCEIYKENKDPPRVNFKYIDNRKLNEEIDKVNSILEKIKTNDITSTNCLLVACTRLIAERLGIKEREKKRMETPRWKRRLEQDVAELRRSLSKLERKHQGEQRNNQGMARIEKKYKVHEKGIKVVIEELKQRIIAKSEKIKRYSNRNEQFRLNRMFLNNQAKVYRELDGSLQENVAPDADDALTFWSSIWGENVEHNRNAEWLNDVRESIGKNSQASVRINTENLKHHLKKVPNWKAPGPDGLQGFWIKKLTVLHARIATQLQEVLETGSVPGWMTLGKTVLCVKDPSKGNASDNFRPISCLPIMLKVFTGIISDKVYNYIEDTGLFPIEQKGCHRGCRGTKDQLLIDKLIIKNCKRRKTNLSMAWIDYKKAYDMVPHSWILECLKMVGVDEKVVSMLEGSMEKWEVELTAAGQKLGNVKLKRGIFQGDSLSPLLFVVCLIPLSIILRKCRARYSLGKNQSSINHLLFMDDLKLYGKSKDEIDSLVRTVRLFSQDIGMEFGVKKCAVVVMKRGKVTECEGIELPDGQRIRAVEQDGYKYLGILEIDTIKQKEMKELVIKEYRRRLKRTLKSRLNGKNVILAINTWAVSIFRYGAGIIDWTKAELDEIDRKTRKTLTMYGAFNPNSNVDRLYLARKQGGRGLISIVDCVSQEKNSLSWYVKHSVEPLLKEVGKQGVVDIDKAREPEKVRKEVYCQHKQGWLEKKLHGKMLSEVSESMDDERTWLWVQKGGLKKETESTIFAAQEQAIRTNAIKQCIDKQDVSPLCRMCGKWPETIAHITTECQQLAGHEYKLWRHNKVAQVLHWHMCDVYGFERAERWYDHTPEPILENDEHKILWDFQIQTDHQLKNNRPDLVVVDKKSRDCIILDVACPFDTRIIQKENEKVEKYQDLKREIKRLWKLKKVSIVPIVIGALGTISHRFHDWLLKSKIECPVEMLQKVCLLGTAKILRKVLDT